MRQPMVLAGNYSKLSVRIISYFELRHVSAEGVKIYGTQIHSQFHGSKREVSRILRWNCMKVFAAPSITSYSPGCLSLSRSNLLLPLLALATHLPQAQRPKSQRDVTGKSYRREIDCAHTETQPKYTPYTDRIAF
jgi:hypothetical protein